LPGTRRVEIRTPALTRVLELVRGFDWAADPTILSESLRLLVPQTMEDREVAARLEAAGVEEKLEVRGVAPSLEDVFVSLTAEAERDRAGR